MLKLKTGIFFLLSFFLFFYLSIPQYSGDVKNHVVWAESILKMGPMGLYEREFHDFAYPNYPPLSMGLFVASLGLYNISYQSIFYLNDTITFFPSKLVHFIENTNTKITFLKLPAIAATIALGYFIFYLVKVEKKQPFLKGIFLTALFLFNPAIFYLSVVWGQIDNLQIMFLIFSIYFLFKKRLLLSAFLMALALLSKQTILVFYLIYLLIVLKIFRLKSLLKSMRLTLIICYLSYVPFIGLNPFETIELYRANFTYVAKVTQVNSINLWGSVYNYQSLSDHQLLWGLSFQVWGYILFALIFTPLLIYFIKNKFGDNPMENFSKTTNLFFITSLIYFLFLTRMHERYIVPAVIFVTLLFIFQKKQIINLLFFSTFTFLNLYRGLEIPDIGFLRKLVFNIQFLNVLFYTYVIFLVGNLVSFFKPKNG